MAVTAARYDRSAILRDAWARARQAAAEAAEGVRQFISAAMRGAWATAKAALQGPAKPAELAAPAQLDLVDYIASLPAAPQVSPARQALLDKIDRNDAAVVALQAEIERDLTLGMSNATEAKYERLDGMHALGLNLRDELRDLEASQAAAGHGPDLTTVEGLKAALVGQSAILNLSMGDVTYTVVDITRWTSRDGSLVRDYVRVELDGLARDETKGPIGIFIERAGGPPRGAALPMATKAGTAWWCHGQHCDSGNKRWHADKLVRDLLAAIGV